MDNLHIFLGATVADAATRPLHWVYDPKKLKKYANYPLSIALLFVSDPQDAFMSLPLLLLNRERKPAS